MPAPPPERSVAVPPPEASTDAATHPRNDARSGTDPGADSQDTLDLRLPDELLALFGANAGVSEVTGAVGADGSARDAGPAAECRLRSGWETGPAQPEVRSRPAVPAGEDLLDRVGDWGPTTTAAGTFRLVPVCVDRDLALISRWMNDPAVAAFWELSGPGRTTEDHVLAQLGGDGRSVPCLGMLHGTPMSYWEIYRADLDPLARHYPARPHDTGIHLLIGGVARRGRGLGTLLLRAVSDLVLDRRPSCARVVAEPDLRNVPSVSAFLGAGFRFSAEADLPGKKAALMIRDRALRGLL